MKEQRDHFPPISLHGVCLQLKFYGMCKYRKAPISQSHTHAFAVRKKMAVAKVKVNMQVIFIRVLYCRDVHCINDVKINSSVNSLPLKLYEQDNW